MVFKAFKAAPKMAWFGLLALTIFLEVEPLPLEIYPPLFYSYKLFKGILFLALGYLTPLAFWRFNSLGRGVLIAFASACFVEILQGFFRGHAFSFFELLLKLVVILFGFSLALNARYEKKINFGWLQIHLRGEHLNH